MAIRGSVQSLGKAAAVLSWLVPALQYSSACLSCAATLHAPPRQGRWECLRLNPPNLQFTASHLQLSIQK